MTSCGSPAQATTRPSATATACTGGQPRRRHHGHLDLDRAVHRRQLCMPELPEVEAWVRELDPLVSRRPSRARPLPHRDREDVRAAAHRARRANARGLRAPRQEPPLPDRRRRPRPPGPPDERRAAPLPRARCEDSENADVPARLRGRRRARAHRGRQEEAGGRLAVHSRGPRGRARSPRSRRARPRPRAARRDRERERRQLHPLLRDQRAIAGIGRAHANEILWLAKLSPFKSRPSSPTRRSIASPRRWRRI